MAEKTGSRDQFVSIHYLNERAVDQKMNILYKAFVKRTETSVQNFTY